MSATATPGVVAGTPTPRAAWGVTFCTDTPSRALPEFGPSAFARSSPVDCSSLQFTELGRQVTGAAIPQHRKRDA